jgi:subtilisin family serine protease
MKAKFAKMLAVLVALTMVIPVSAMAGPLEPAASGVSGIYIVQLKDPPLPAYEGDIAGLQATSIQVTGAAKLDVNAPASVRYVNYLKTKQAQFLTNAAKAIGRKPEVVFQYQLALNGMAVRLTAAEAAALTKLDGVAEVVSDWVEYAQTDNGPTWIGADEIWDGSATGVDTKGEGMVIGIVDTGINMDHPSFADVGGDGYNHTNPRGKLYGWCDPANTEVYTTAVTCNDKLIGVWSFDADLPEDYNGHGSHVGSTAAGNVITAVVQAPTTSVTRTISGVAPHANIIAYSIEGTPGTGSAPGSSIAAAFEQVKRWCGRSQLLLRREQRSEPLVDGKLPICACPRRGYLHGHVGGQYWPESGYRLQQTCTVVSGSGQLHPRPQARKRVDRFGRRHHAPGRHDGLGLHRGLRPGAHRLFRLV